jgi:hypothetical protein
LCSTVLAQQPAPKSQPAAQPAPSSEFYFGVKGGLMDPDGKNNDAAFNIAAVVGQPIQRYLSWEGELSASLSDGEVAGRDWDVNSIAGYGVFRTEGKVMLKGKLGLAYWDAADDDDLSLSLGVGVDIRLAKNGALEVEFTQIDDQIDFLSVGYLFNF